MRCNRCFNAERFGLFDNRRRKIAVLGADVTRIAVSPAEARDQHVRELRTKVMASMTLEDRDGGKAYDSEQSTPCLANGLENMIVTLAMSMAMSIVEKLQDSAVDGNWLIRHKF